MTKTLNFCKFVNCSCCVKIENGLNFFQGIYLHHIHLSKTALSSSFKGIYLHHIHLSKAALSSSFKGIYLHHIQLLKIKAMKTQILHLNTFIYLSLKCSLPSMWWNSGWIITICNLIRELCTFFFQISRHVLDIVKIENRCDPDQLASGEASWTGSTLFFIHTINPYYVEIAPPDWLKTRNSYGINAPKSTQWVFIGACVYSVNLLTLTIYL